MFSFKIESNYIENCTKNYPQLCGKKGLRKACCDIQGPKVIKEDVEEVKVIKDSVVDEENVEATTSGPPQLQQPQNGEKKLGSFTTFFSEVSGTVFELNEKFLLIKDFNYDGKGLAPIFLAGTSGTPGGDGEVGIHFGIYITHKLALAGALHVIIDLSVFPRI